MVICTLISRLKKHASLVEDASGDIDNYQHSTIVHSFSLPTVSPEQL